LLTAGTASHVPTKLFEGVLASNSAHKLWTQRQLTELLGDVKGKTVAILGLTYKPGTNTLRRSSAVETCRWLIEHEARVQAFDPAIHELPEDLRAIHLAPSAETALKGADAALIATAWPEFKLLPAELFEQTVLDPARYLESNLCNVASGYYSIGVAR